MPGCPEIKLQEMKRAYGRSSEVMAALRSFAQTKVYQSPEEESCKEIHLLVLSVVIALILGAQSVVQEPGVSGLPGHLSEVRSLHTSLAAEPECRTCILTRSQDSLCAH